MKGFHTMFGFAYANMNKMKKASAGCAEVSFDRAKFAAAFAASVVSIISIILGLHLLALVVVLICAAVPVMKTQSVLD